jgi:hypothetical protein
MAEGECAGEQVSHRAGANIQVRKPVLLEGHRRTLFGISVSIARTTTAAFLGGAGFERPFVRRLGTDPVTPDRAALS